MTQGLTPDEQEFEDELKTQIKKVIVAVYAIRYAGREGYNRECGEVPDEICEAILDRIACEQVLGLSIRPSNHTEFRAMVLRIVNEYLPGLSSPPPSGPSTTASPGREPPG